MKTLFLFFLIPSFLYSAQPDNIKLKNGSFINNCKIIDSTISYYVVQTSSGLRNINREAVSTVYFAPYDSTKETEFISDIPAIIKLNPYNPDSDNLTDGYERPNIILLSVSAALAYLSYDYIKTASDMGDVSDDSKLQDIKVRTTIGGIVFGIAAIVNTVFALKKVKVTNTINSVGLSYNF